MTDPRTYFLEIIKDHLPITPVCAEIGTHEGIFAKLILDTFQPRKLHLIDPFEESAGAYANGLKTAYSTNDDYIKVIKRFLHELEANQVHIHKSYSINALNEFQDDYFDLIYLDGCHLYECVKSDLMNYLPKLKEHGLMCGDDYMKHEDFGVIEAVDEIVKENDLEFLVLEGNNYALRRK